MDTRVHYYYASILKRRWCVGINGYKFSQLVLQSAIATIVYIKHMHELLFFSIFSIAMQLSLGKKFSYHLSKK